MNNSRFDFPLIRLKTTDLSEGTLAGHAVGDKGWRAGGSVQHLAQVVIGAGADAADAGNLDVGRSYFTLQCHLCLSEGQRGGNQCSFSI